MTFSSFWRLLTPSCISWDLVQIFCRGFVKVRHSQLMFEFYEEQVRWPTLTLTRGRRGVFCLHQAGTVLSRRLEQVRCEVWKVWLRTKRVLSPGDVSLQLAPVSAVSPAEMMGLNWDEKWSWNTFIRFSTSSPYSQGAEIYCLWHSTVQSVWEHKTLSGVFSSILLNPGNLYVIILFTTSCGWWKWVEVSKLRVWGL